MILYMDDAIVAAGNGAKIAMRKIHVDHETLLALLSYDPETGIFKWNGSLPLVNMGSAKRGGIAGHIDKQGYRYLTILKKVYLAHRIAWFYVHKVWPDNEIDHVNGVRDDNRIANLRVVPHAKNMQNMRAEVKDKSRLPGTSRTPSGKWQAKIKIDGKLIYLGLFATTEAAHAAYIEKRRNNS